MSFALSIVLRLLAPVDTGLQFTLDNHATPQKHIIETMPGGIAVFDYDNDGRPDVFFTNGAGIPSMHKDSSHFANRLFRNLGGLKFEDVTASAGLAGDGYSMGAAAADFDNDGHVDLFVTGVRSNRLYRNLGNGKFEDVTAASGIKSDEWSVAAGWFDFDNDGLLDLIVINYGAWTPSYNRFCGDAARNLRIYCHPKYFDPRPNQLYRNLGNGKFADVSAVSGIAGHKGRGMSVAFADYDNDGRLDVFVTNDNLPNFLFRNLGGGKFAETALAAGVALLDTGKPVASMGADFRDYDNDGLPDIAVTALNGETFPLFRNRLGGAFSDATYASKLGSQTVARSGWGVQFADFDNDGWKDLVTANSHVNDVVEQVEKATYKQRNTIFRNSAGKFDSTIELDGPARAHRGSVAADFDGDGKLDLVVSSLNEPAELWRNESAAGHWIVLKLTGVKSNRDGIGARITIGKQTNILSTAVSYASSVHAGVHFGLGAATLIDAIEIRWPSGVTQRLTNIKADQILAVTEPK